MLLRTYSATPDVAYLLGAEGEDPSQPAAEPVAIVPFPERPADWLAQHRAGAWRWWERTQPGRHWAAPLVGQSELAFRMLVRRYGASCCSTPMLDPAGFALSERYRALFPMQETEPHDRPLIAQFGGSKSGHLVDAARLARPRCDGVELNVGCPQRCARKGNYGAFLMHQPELLCRLVRAMAEGSGCTVLVKMRIFDEVDRTVALARQLEAAGASVLTVHGRTKEKGGGKGQKGPADWPTIKAVKGALGIPVVSNGNIDNLEQAEACLQFTGCDAVMSGCGLLANPALFSGQQCSPVELCLKYLERSKQYQQERPDYQCVIKHLFSILGKGTLAQHQDVRTVLNNYRGGDSAELRSALMSMECKGPGVRPDQRQHEDLQHEYDPFGEAVHAASKRPASSDVAVEADAKRPKPDAPGASDEHASA